MNTTRHAKVRAQQRGFPPIAVEMILRFGHRERAGDGAWKCYLDKAGRRALAAYAGPIAVALERHLDAYAVVGEDDRVITIAHRTERIHRN